MSTRRELEEDGLDRRKRFELDVLPYLDALYRAALRIGDAIDAEDVVQEALARAFAGFHGHRDAVERRVWLYRLLVDTCRRRRLAYAGEVTSRRPSETGPFAEASAPPPEEAVESLAALPRPAVVAAFDALPPRHRTVVYLADAEGFAPHEIAEVTGTSTGAVVSELHRGRRLLRSLLEAAARRERGARAMGGGLLVRTWRCARHAPGRTR